MIPIADREHWFPTWSWTNPAEEKFGCAKCRQITEAVGILVPAPDDDGSITWRDWVLTFITLGEHSNNSEDRQDRAALLPYFKRHPSGAATRSEVAGGLLPVQSGPAFERRPSLASRNPPHQELCRSAHGNRNSISA